MSLTNVGYVLLELWRRLTSPRGTTTSRTQSLPLCLITRTTESMESPTSKLWIPTIPSMVLARARLMVSHVLAARTLSSSVRFQDRSCKRWLKDRRTLMTGKTTVTSIRPTVKNSLPRTWQQTQSAARSCRPKMASSLLEAPVTINSRSRQACLDAQQKLQIRSCVQESLKVTTHRLDPLQFTQKHLKGRILTWVPQLVQTHSLALVA